MRSNRQVFGRLLLASLAAGPVLGQSPSDISEYRWGAALAEAPFGFDDMAEAVFNRMISEPGRTATEKLQGRTGIADLKRKQARTAAGLDAKLKLFDEAIAAIKAVKKEWPDKNSPGYFDVVFKTTDMLQQRGEAAMDAANDETVAAARADELKAKASSDFTEAKTELDAVRQQFKDASSETARNNWRLKNRGWLGYCLMLVSEAQAAKDGSVQQGTSLTEAARELDEFVLQNESDDDVESMIGALYGQVYRGKVARLQKSLDDAVNAYEAVIKYVPLDKPGAIDPTVQPLTELAFLELLEALNAERRFDDARTRGEQMEAAFKFKKAEFGVRGRAARVEFARACFESGDFGRALVVASEVARDGKSDVSGARATKLIAQIISSAPDKRSFNPEVLLNAANGAYQDRQNAPEKRAEAVQYFRMALPILDQIKDEKARYEAAVEAWFKYGFCLQESELYLEAAHAFAEGYKTTWAVKKDLLQSEASKTFAGNLFTRWKACVDEFARQTKSPEAAKLSAELNDVLAKAPPPDTALFSPGDSKYEEAAKLEKEGKFDEAAKAYEAVSGPPPDYKNGLGGRYTERAIVKANVCRSKVAKKLLEKKDPGAAAAAQAAVASFDAYLKLSNDPARRETDPTKAAERKNAQAEAKWNISELQIDLAGTLADEAAKKSLLASVVTLLAGFETLHPEQKSLVVFAVANRVEAQILMGAIPAAEADYQALRKIDAEAPKTGEVASKLGKAIRTPVDEKRKALDAKKDAAAIAALNPELLRSAKYYRDWLLGADARGDKSAKSFANWEAVARQFFDADDLASASDLYRQALDKFSNTAAAKPEELQRARYYLARANDKICEQMVMDGKDALRLYTETAHLLNDHLMKPDATNRYAKQPDLLRIAARTWGGYVYQKSGNIAAFAGTGDYAKAFDVWKDKIKPGTEGGSEEWWEATFYTYYLVMKQQDVNKGPSFEAERAELKKKYGSLKAANQQEPGGAAWKAQFKWLEAKMI